MITNTYLVIWLLKNLVTMKTNGLAETTGVSVCCVCNSANNINVLTLSGMNTGLAKLELSCSFQVDCFMCLT